MHGGGALWKPMGVLQDSYNLVVLLLMGDKAFFIVN